MSAPAFGWMYVDRETIKYTSFLHTSSSQRRVNMHQLLGYMHNPMSYTAWEVERNIPFQISNFSSSAPKSCQSVSRSCPVIGSPLLTPPCMWSQKSKRQQSQCLFRTSSIICWEEMFTVCCTCGGGGCYWEAAEEECVRTCPCKGGRRVCACALVCACFKGV